MFNDIAHGECKRWSERSLGVARALLVEERSLSDAAVAFGMTPQQANVIRSRFTEKARRQRLKQFMKQETPKQFFIFLQPFADDITVLQSKGYTIKQIVGYLAENGVQATESSVRNFLRKRA